MPKRPGTTLRGSGWLRESPRNHVPPEWLAIRGHSVLRKCLFLPALREPSPMLRARGAGAAEPHDTEVMPAVFAPEPMPVSHVPPRKLDPMRHARMFPANATPLVQLRAAEARARDAGYAFDADHARQDIPLTPRRAWSRSERTARRARHESWLHSPLALGIFLIALPPVGLAAVWSSPRYDREGRLALTFTSALFMCLATVAAIMLAR